MMTPDEFEDWALNHIAALGLGDRAIGTVMAWEEAFSQLFSAAELREATSSMLSKSDIPPFAGKQRGVIIASIAMARKKRRAGDVEPAAKAQGCSICGNTGFAIVPHPGKDEHNQLYCYLRTPADDPTGIHRDLAICCSCDKGQRTAAGRTEAGDRPWTIASFTERYPDWELIQSERVAIRELLRKAENESSAPVDIERLLIELARRMKLPKKHAIPFDS